MKNELVVEKTDNNTRPVCVNWTITTRCNYGCKYCFARFPELAGKDAPSPDEMKRIVELLDDVGCEKLTFVGGEPTLSEYLPELLARACELGMTTMIVTNGTGLTGEFLEKNRRNLDWVSLSIDSQFEDVQQRLGRGGGNHVEQTLENARLLKKHGIRLKVNSVITRHNYREDLSVLMGCLAPERWKVFQVLPVKGQNDQFMEELVVTEREFRDFVDRHRYLDFAVFEDNEAMTGSYLMLSPHGRFFSNTSGRHEYTDSILEVGVSAALAQNLWNESRFVERGGLYDWTAGAGKMTDNYAEPIIHIGSEEVI